MGRFLVERYLPGAAEGDLDDLLERIASSAPSMQERFGVVHVRSVVIPSDEACMCTYEGDDADTVRRANEAADLPIDRVVAADERP